jgi:Squalene-hopene cyclase C-terminal domain
MILPLVVASFLSAGPSADYDPSPARLQQAVQRALPLIQTSLEEYPKHRDCFSCHHHAAPVIALKLASERGFTIAEDALSEPAEHTEADLRSAIESYRKAEGQGGGVTRAGYALWTLEASGWPADETTAAVVQFLLKRDATQDYWRGSSSRPPSEASFFTSTYVAIRALRAYGSTAQKPEIDARVNKARHWLEKANPKDTEDRVFRLLGLKAAGCENSILQQAVRDLLQTQYVDGGWAQLDGHEPDPYATGTALVALRLAGELPADAPAVRNGLAFLLRTQRQDGSWYVPTRSKAFQPYFESGFPYGKDQFISMAASAWAVAALVLGGSDAPK